MKPVLICLAWNLFVDIAVFFFFFFILGTSTHKIHTCLDQTIVDHSPRTHTLVSLQSLQRYNSQKKKKCNCSCIDLALVTVWPVTVRIDCGRGEH